MSYKTDLKHPNWQRKRLAVLQRDEWKCTRCGGGESQLHAHHTKYRKGRKPWEYPDSDIVTLCEHCHGGIHALDCFKGVAIPWVYFDKNAQEGSMHFWTGEYAQKDDPTLDDVWICVNVDGEETLLSADGAALYRKPHGIIGEAFSRWVIECHQRFKIDGPFFDSALPNAEVSDRRPAASDSPETHNGGSLH